MTVAPAFDLAKASLSREISGKVVDNNRAGVGRGNELHSVESEEDHDYLPRGSIHIGREIPVDGGGWLRQKFCVSNRGQEAPTSNAGRTGDGGHTREALGDC